jgi:hypothetical protein
VKTRIGATFEEFALAFSIVMPQSGPASELGVDRGA